LLDEHLTDRRQRWFSRSPIEELDAVRILDRLHGLADRRLNAPERPARCRKTPGILNRNEDPELIEGHVCKHVPSPAVMKAISFLSLPEMDAGSYSKGAGRAIGLIPPKGPLCVPYSS
jgi:hypothetical protein